MQHVTMWVALHTLHLMVANLHIINIKYEIKPYGNMFCRNLNHLVHMFQHPKTPPAGFTALLICKYIFYSNKSLFNIFHMDYGFNT